MKTEKKRNQKNEGEKHFYVKFFKLKKQMNTTDKRGGGTRAKNGSVIDALMTKN